LKIHKETQPQRFEPIIEARQRGGGDLVHVWKRKTKPHEFSNEGPNAAMDKSTHSDPAQGRGIVRESSASGGSGRHATIARLHPPVKGQSPQEVLGVARGD